MANMEKEPILSAKDVEICFSLRGKRLNAIRRCSLDLYQGKRWLLWENPVPENQCLPNPSWEMPDANGSVTGGSILFEGKNLAKYKTEKEWMTICGRRSPWSCRIP